MVNFCVTSDGKEFMTRYRGTQVACNHRITAWALEELKRITVPALAADLPGARGV